MLEFFLLPTRMMSRPGQNCDGVKCGGCCVQAVCRLP